MESRQALHLTNKPSNWSNLIKVLALLLLFDKKNIVANVSCVARMYHTLAGAA